MNTPPPLRHTCLHPSHLALGARMTAFAGYEMPLQYEGILAEHQAVRRQAGLFDTCHMGRIELEGPRVAEAFDRLVTCRVSDLPPGRCRYGLMLAPDGGTLDDLIVYRVNERKLMVVVNAGNRESDFEWMRAQLPPDAQPKDVSEALAKIDLQGPGSPVIAASLLNAPLKDLRYFHFVDGFFRDVPLLLSRTGYTGELGFEIYLPADAAPGFWQAAMREGAMPAGLGARDTLRLEAGLPLYGHELSRQRNAAESGWIRSSNLDKDFIGADAVRAAGDGDFGLVGLRLDGRRAARTGDPVLNSKQAEVGVVTSGSYAPSLGAAAAMAYVQREYARPGQRLTVCGRTALEAGVAALPLYRCGSARKPIGGFLCSRDEKQKE